MSRVKKVVPKAASKYAAVVSGLISHASPNKKRALERVGICSPKKAKLMNDTFSPIGKTVGELGRSCKGGPRKTRRDFVRSLITHYDNLKVARTGIGVRKGVLLKCTERPVESKRSDSLTDETLTKVKDFYIRLLHTRCICAAS